MNVMNSGLGLRPNFEKLEIGQRIEDDNSVDLRLKPALEIRTNFISKTADLKIMYLKQSV